MWFPTQNNNYEISNDFDYVESYGSGQLLIIENIKGFNVFFFLFYFTLHSKIMKLYETPEIKQPKKGKFATNASRV